MTPHYRVNTINKASVDTDMRIALTSLYVESPERAFRFYTDVLGFIEKIHMPVMVFGVEDIEAEYRRLKERGVVFRGAPKITEWGTQTLFEDGCGNLIQLQQA